MAIKVLKEVKCHYTEDFLKEDLRVLKDSVAILNLSNIQNIFEKAGDNLKNVLDLKILKDRKLIDKKFLQLKILGTGDLKSIEITANFASKKASEKIEKLAEN